MFRVSLHSGYQFLVKTPKIAGLGRLVLALAWGSAAVATLSGAVITGAMAAPNTPALESHARAVLHQIMVSEQSWIRIHAAEALMAAGESDAIRDYFLRELPTTEKSVFRIGVYRVLATASHSADERAKWTAKAEQVYLDQTAPDQNQAIETLCKLGYHVTGPTLELVRRRTVEPPSAPMALALWSGTLAGEPHALEKLTALLTSTDEALRTSAAYALRWLHPADAAVRAALVRATVVEQPGTTPYAYILGAAITVDADPAQTVSWEAKLNDIFLTGSAGARFEASWTLKHRYRIADLGRVAPLLDLPASENDARVGAASVILTTLARR